MHALTVHELGAVRSIAAIAAGELRAALRSRWFAIDVVAISVLGLAVSLVSASAMGGLAGFGRTSAGLTNLVAMLVPLMALSAGALSISGDRERGMLPFLLAQPITRTELLLGKYIGLLLALVTAICLGFGLCAAALALQAPTTDAGALLRLAALSIVLAAAMLAVGMLVSVVARRASVAAAGALLLWLLLVFGTDLGLMAGTVALRVKVQALFVACMANPLQVFKIWSLHSSDVPLDVLGPVGLYAIDHQARWLSTWMGLSMALWILLPLGAAAVVLRRRDAA